MNNFTFQKNFLIKNGYLVLNFSNKSFQILNQIRLETLKILKKFNNKITSLETCHNFLNDKEFENVVYMVTKMMWKKDFFAKLLKSELKKLTYFFGTDLDFQSYPHIRAARPGTLMDNVGFHRDIDYGASIYENSLWMPITKIDRGAGMSLLTESIFKGYNGYKFIKLKSYKKNSKKNISGFPHTINNVYIKNSLRKKMIEPRIRKNQYLIIPQFLVHGSEINSSKFTRWTFDIRVCNNLYNDPKSSLERKRKKILNKGNYPYYRPLSRSATSILAGKFLNIA